MTGLPEVGDFYTPMEVTGFRATGQWIEETPPTILEQLAFERPDDVFAIDSVGTLTYREFRDRAWRLAGAMQRLGVARGDCVIVQLPNWNELLIAMMAVTRAGAVLVPAMTTYRADEIEFLIDNTGARAAITTGVFRGFDHAAMLSDALGRRTSLELGVLVRGHALPGMHRFEDLISGTEEPEEPELGPMPNPDAPHIVLHTSGSESQPKGCVHSYNTAAFTSRAVEQHHAWTPADRSFGPSPVAHSNGYINHYLVPLRAGASTVLMEKWDPRLAIDLVDEHRCTVTVTSTTFLSTLIETRRDGDDLSSMRLWVASGTVIPPEVVRRARLAMPDCEVLSQYGRSENLLTTLCPSGTDPGRALTSDGLVPPGIDVMLFDGDGQQVVVGPGEVGYRGPGHMLGYVRRPDLTQAMINSAGYSLSGDLGEFDADGFLRITGRIKDIIIRGGVNISAREVEDHLLTHPAVHDVAVVAMPDPRLGERACAFVVAEAGAQIDLDQICTYLRDERGISVQKLPERLELIEVMPISPTGKIDKADLRRRVREDDTDHHRTLA
ncbi:cyclohexanecarboxylate-CoA ligase [Nocardioides seonyuensis]|uniref:Cyclohexanecarboxylate-CoA ligase n=1 Tax=Nocardioides seonyuensis TaxID=2518371 RepID=A0A4P7II88_9ACTN|nr:AMP-binding protein [Nocardioides seonyuensis]QBX55947.1 cyclohexanecarboxylate-CoA ligase [Nocardioides seonyuensis]